MRWILLKTSSFGQEAPCKERKSRLKRVRYSNFELIP